MRKIIIIIILIILIGVYIGFTTYNNSKNNISDNISNNKQNLEVKEHTEISSMQIDANEQEKTTPNTLIIYKIYYIKCKHFTQEYEDIDSSLVNCSEEEFKDKYKEWNIEKFSSKEIILSKEEENFCNEHYKLVLEENRIVIYNVNENGKETMYEETDITTEYLTEEDVLKLKAGIIIYGKENLITAIEDYE